MCVEPREQGREDLCPVPLLLFAERSLCARLGTLPPPPGLVGLTCQLSWPQCLPHSLCTGCSLCLKRSPRGTQGPLPRSIRLGQRGCAQACLAPGPMGEDLRPSNPTPGHCLNSEIAGPDGAPTAPLSGSSLSPAGASRLNHHPFCFTRSSRTSGTVLTVWT